MGLGDFAGGFKDLGIGLLKVFVQTPVVMERTMVDAMHYGLGSYRISDTSIDELYRARGFRGVLYKDGSKRLWVYGEVTEGAPAPCH